MNTRNYKLNKGFNIGKKIIYYPKSYDKGSDEGKNDEYSNYLLKGNKSKQDLLKYFFPDILKALGDNAIKDNPPTIQELEFYLQTYFQKLIEDENAKKIKDKDWKNWIERQTSHEEKNLESQKLSAHGNSRKSNFEKNSFKNNIHDSKLNLKGFAKHSYNLPDGFNKSSSHSIGSFRLNFESDQKKNNNFPIVTELIERGYLVDSNKWLKKKGFWRIGQEILAEIIKSLKSDKLGMHETKFRGSGNIIQENSKKYEFGNEISNININSTILNFIERRLENKDANKLKFPLEISYEDLEIYDTLEEIQVATVYCIDLSSTMRYSSLYNDLSRLEASKRALWSLYILNKKFFPQDSIYLIGFGSVASKIDTFDIPFLKTFEPNADFLHYTNYQAAYRLGKKILKKDGAKNKRIVMITDGHPSACFIDNLIEKEKIMKQRPYSHFYIPNKTELDNHYRKENGIKMDINENQTVYLCYRYRQIDQYIGEQTIKEAKKTFKEGINIDTIMVSEEDSLLDFVNELAKSVHGKSIYINQKNIDKILITDYLLNKKKIVKK